MGRGNASAPGDPDVEIDMSQDLIRQSQRGQPGEDIWGVNGQPAAGNGLAYPSAQPMGGGLGYPAAPGGGGGGLATNDVKPLQTIHRSLRGRYKLAVLLAAVGAVVGGAAGWKLNNKVYRANGAIRINPVTFLVNGNEATPEYGRYMNSEANSLRSQDIAELAMRDPAWRAVAGDRPINGGTRAAFLSGLKASYNGSSYDISVTYDDGNPNVAVAAIDSVLDAYATLRQSAQVEKGGNSVSYYENQVKLTQDKIDDLKRRVGALQRESQGNIEERSATMGKAVGDLEQQLDQAELASERMNIVKQRFVAHPQQIDNQLLAQKEPFFARLLQARDDLVLQLNQLQQIQGPGSPVVLKLQNQLASVNARVDSIAQQLSKGFYGMLQPLGSAPAMEVSDASIEAKQGDIDLLKARLEIARKDLATVDDKRVTLTELADQIKTKADALADLSGRLAQAQGRTVQLNAPFRTIPDPSPAVAEDKRATMATFGFVLGAGLPLAGLVALGLLDRKYRYSDETNASSITRGIPLLGILPNLPDRLSDPSQASVAAHCVHQIRTMLQLNAVRADGPTVLSVTSATSGDGKTSLSLALGLSFAASGSRTLLIDTDLIGAGLSARLGIREAQGISEAIVARNPMEYVRDTDVSDLSILPVGVNGPQNASAFSPNAVRRLLGEMRKHFDLILIDTGPVLGSIEATPVVASSDSVILTASRGQNRDLVEKAILQLRNAGARIAGFVFNRANAKDFERSISGISLRSVSRERASQPGAAGQSVNGQYQDNRLGPLVHSVRGTSDDSQG